MSVVDGEDSKVPEKAVSPDRPDFEAMIDGLASRNRKPKFVSIESGDVPQFDAEYDWGESERVRRLWVKLIKNDDPRLWYCLLDHTNDTRYALTVQRYGGQEDSRISAGCGGENVSVGDICWEAACARFNFAGLSSSKEDEDADQDIDVWDLGIVEDPLSEWRKKRAALSLYELQLQVCEQAVEKIGARAGLRRQTKINATKSLRNQIVRLKETKKPLFFQISLDDRGSYDARKAQEIRNRIANERRRKKPD
jgi:hypothetical protein